MQTIKPKAAQASRQDPRPRPIDALTGMVALRDRDPRMDYVWAPEVGFFDVSYYESMGWQKCLLAEGGVQPLRRGASKEGGFITQLNQILMCRPKAEVKQEWQDGQADVDETEKRIFDQSFGRRLLSRYRGLSGYVDAVNESAR